MNSSEDRSCPFCASVPKDHIAENALAFAKWDGYPISKGHALIIPRRHLPSFFDCNGEEKAALMQLLDSAKSLIDGLYNPDGYNIGINCAEAAGQTVMHAHMHLIPRYAGDVPDPRGGVRWIFPDKAVYWAR